LSKDLNEKICRYLDMVAVNYDVIIVTDYGHGFFNRDIINILSEKSKFLAVNTQTNSANPGFNLITKYPRADYICIDELELRWATGERFEEISDLIGRIVKLLKSKSMIVTCGHRGSIAHNSGTEQFFKIPVFSGRVIDPVGAGDAFLAVTSPCVAKGLPIDLVGFIGNAVGAIAVTIVGNKSSVEPEQLFNFIRTLLK
jgi:sugar/nucleoside kinase (ribokinase family)